MGGLDRERLLMLAVLEDAVDCFQKYALSKDPRGRLLFSEAKDWVDSGDKGWLFSFENICDTLEIDPSYVRRGLTRWREQQRSRGRARPYTVSHDRHAGSAAGADDALRRVPA
jgi:hypothetical protein